MGPDEYCLMMARFLINAHPNISVHEIDLAYWIMDHTDQEYDQFIDGAFSCNDFAAAMKLQYPIQISDDETNLALTIQDWVDKVKTGDGESE
jgi:hypothetical protein